MKSLAATFLLLTCLELTSCKLVPFDLIYSLLNNI